MATLAILLIAQLCNGDNSIVQTSYGPIQGKITPMIREFLSIPYAAPPINSLRFENPQPHNSWSNTLQTTAIPPGCPQVTTLILTTQSTHIQTLTQTIGMHIRWHTKYMSKSHKRRLSLSQHIHPISSRLYQHKLSCHILHSWWWIYGKLWLWH